MMSATFEVDVEGFDGHTAIRLRGHLTGAGRQAMDDAYGSADADLVVLDFTDVGYINSTGIAVVVGVLARARAENRQVRAFGLDDHYQKIFQITRIADFMAIFEDETAAVAS